ncbi:hypothetical protein BAU06_07195 [Bordetella bronchialis]|uniref:AAA+ ATPase domain-containing protein n=2 Tax=Bordetella bronchialis TaxID=463025 RepID=A0ABM6CQ27_9BORD|nr:hypothetical protein BAU06_07195 [Bordetella bronchialis]
MYDLDIRRILYEEDMSERSLFVIGPIDEANELDAEDLADLGLLAPIGVDSFAEQVRLQAMEHVYRDEELLLSVWTRQEDPQPTSSPPTDAQVRDFLVYGRAMESLLPEAASVEAYRYCLPRQEVVPIFEAIRSSPGITVVHGGLGTGKTFLSYVVGHMLSRAGFLVYRLDTASSDAMSEVEEILRTSGDKVFIIDGYRRHLRMLERIVELTGSDCRLLLLERSSSHEVIADELDDLALKTVEFDLDELTQSELRSANDLLDRHGLWGERQAWGEARKLSYLRNDCESRLPHLLVSVLEAVHVSERYREVVASSPDSRGVRTLLIATSVLTVLNHIPRVSVLQELLGPALILSKYRRYEELKDIIDITSMDVRIRSSVLAQHLLQKVFSAGDIADVLIGLVRQADALKRQERLFAQVHADLMRYSNVAQMLPEKQRLAAITRYYENIKDLPSTRANPQFWLQYAIGCLTNRALDRAATYFADAYSWAAKVDDYDTFQIDNHYARFLLQKALTDQPAVDALQQVLQARDIVLRQVRTEIRKYPFRVACSLFDAYESLSSKMAPDFQKQLRGSLAEIYRRASQTKGNLYRDRYVQECIRRGEPFERVSS